MNAVRILLAIAMFSLFFGGSLVGYGLMPSMMNSIIPDICIAGLVVLAMVRSKERGFKIKVVGIAYLLALSVFTILSALVTDSAWISVVLFIRLLVRFYVMFIVLLNIGLSEKTQLWALRSLAFLFLLQIPVAAGKLLIYGQGESAIGTYAVHGGGLSTAIPMVATAFLVSFYVGYRRHLAYLIALVGFIAFGIIGGKRAVFVLVPLVGLFSLWLSVDVRIGRMLKLAPHLLGIGMIFVLAFYATVRLTPTLNPERMIMGSFDISYVTDYFMSSQVDAYSQNNEAQGRFSTTKVFLDEVNDSASTALVGFGPGMLLKTEIEGAGREKSEDMYGMQYGGGLEQFGVLYGITGFSWLLVQIGWPGTIVWLAFYVYLFGRFIRFSKSEDDPFWKSFHRSMAGFAIVVLVISLIYGSYMIMGDLMVFVFFLLSAVSFSRNKYTARNYMA